MSLYRRAYLIAALLLASLALAPSAFAQLRAGTYGVEGQNPDGSAYEGTSS